MNHKVSLQKEPWDLPEENIILVGLFNPEILSPAWVHKFVFPQEDQSKAEVMFGVGRGAPGVTYRIHEIYWRPTRNKLVVNGPPDQASVFVSKVLELLPHAPVTAAGVNFSRFGKFSDRSGLFRFDFLGGEVARLLEGQPTTTSHSEAVQRQDGTVLTVKVTFRSEDRDHALIDFNFHRDAKGDDDLDRANQLREHVERAKAFSEDADRISEVLLNG